MAARYAFRAARRAHDALAFDRAARWYRQSLELDPGAPEHAQRLRLQLAHALSHAGRGLESAEMYLAALEHAPESETLEIQRLAAEQFVRSGRIDQGLQTLESVLATIGARVPRSRGKALALLLYERARVRWRGFTMTRRAPDQVPAKLAQEIRVLSTLYSFGLTNPLRGSAFNLRHLRRTLDAGVPGWIPRPLSAELVVLASSGSKVRPQVDARIAFGRLVAAESKEPFCIGVMEAAAGVAAYLAGEFRRSVELCIVGERILRDECSGTEWEMATAQAFHARSLGWMGELGELRRLLPQWIKEARERSDLYRSINLRVGNPMAHVALADDDPALARQHAAEAMAEWSNSDVSVEHIYELLGLGAVELYTGDIDGADRRMRATWPRLAKAMMLRFEVTRVSLHQLRGRIALACAGRLGDGKERESRLRDAAKDARALKKEKARWAPALGALLDAGVLGLRNDDAAAQASLEAAEQALESADLMMFAAAARWQRGQRVGGADGAALKQRAEQWMSLQGIVRPELFAELLAPGCAGPR
jgi:hypothetical protein